MRTLYGSKLTLSERWCRAVLALVVAVLVGASGTLAGSDLLPAATALPCPDGSQTCGPQPTQDPGPTQGNQVPTTAPQAPQTTIPPNTDTGGPTPPTNGNPGFQGTVQSMPTADNPDGCIVNCGPTQPQGPGQAPTPTPTRPPSTATATETPVKPHDPPPKEADVTEIAKNKNRMQCLIAQAAAESGSPIPGLANFRDQGVSGALKNRVAVTIVPADATLAQKWGFTPDQLSAVTRAAMANWNQVSKVKFDEGSPDPGGSTLRITFEDVDRGAIAATAGQQPSSMAVHLGVLTAYKGDEARLVQIVMHEMGHTLGIGHTCPGSVMDGSGNPGMSLSPLDAALANEGK